MPTAPHGPSGLAEGVWGIPPREKKDPRTLAKKGVYQVRFFSSRRYELLYRTRPTRSGKNPTQQGAPPRCSAVCRMVLKNTQALGSFAELRPFARGPSDYNNDAMVYTYIDLTHASRGLSKASSAMDMIALWASSWARHGWTPRLLTREDVERDPGYRAFERLANETATMVSKSRHGGKTTSADSTFRLRGLTQFYAKAVAGAGVLTDSDVINYGLTPQDVRGATRGVPNVSKVVVIHDARNCEEVSLSAAKAHIPRYYFRPEGYADSMERSSLGTIQARAPIACVKTNNGLTSGSGQAYLRLIDAMLSFQRKALEQPVKNANLIAMMTEMRLLNMLGPKHAGLFRSSEPMVRTNWAARFYANPPVASNALLAVAPLCVTFNAVNGAWRRAKTVHYYGSGIANWVRAMCSETATDALSTAQQRRAWKVAGVCDKRGPRAKLVRFLRDPMQMPQQKSTVTSLPATL
jgi:hypothetical protein